MHVDKRIMVMGAGAGVGAVISPVIKKWVEPYIGTQVPYLNTLGVWGTYHVFVPMVSGAALILVTQFTDYISRRHVYINDGLAMFGFAALASAVITGLVESMPTARAGALTMNNRNVPVRIAPQQSNQMVLTPTGVSGKTIVS